MPMNSISSREDHPTPKAENPVAFKANRASVGVAVLLTPALVASG